MCGISKWTRMCIFLIFLRSEFVLHAKKSELFSICMVRRQTVRYVSAVAG
jgi:hypothetical protein